MNTFYKFLFVVSIMSVGVMGVAFAGILPTVADLGLLLFPPGTSNMQPYRIELDSVANTVTATPQVEGAPELFWYDGATGKGLAKVQETLFALDVNEATTSVMFTQYVHTGAIFPAQNTMVNGGVITGSAIVEGIPVFVIIDETVSPSLVNVNVAGSALPPVIVYPQSNYAPIVVGDFIYAIEPNAPSTGLFQIRKWMRYSDNSTSGVYTAPATPSNVSHLVISEVQVRGAATSDDFIELYNPTNLPVNLLGYRLVKRTAATTTDTPIKAWSATTTIPAHGFYLWANSGYTSIGVTPDATTTETIANNNNGIALRFGAANTGAVIDSVAWGQVQNNFNEGNALMSTLPAGSSYERKLWQGIACFSSQGVGEELGNGCDTNDNDSDFNVRSVATPQNTTSSPEP